MAAHTREQRDFIVRRLAAFYTPDDIIAQFTERWSNRCTVNDIRACDLRYSLIDPDLEALYHAERALFLENMDLAAPTRDPRVRIVMLHRAAEKARENNQVQLLQSILAQIALETGGAVSSDDSAGVTEIRRVIIRAPNDDS